MNSQFRFVLILFLPIFSVTRAEFRIQNFSGKSVRNFPSQVLLICGFSSGLRKNKSVSKEFYFELVFSRGRIDGTGRRDENGQNFHCGISFETGENDAPLVKTKPKK